MTIKQKYLTAISQICEEYKPAKHTFFKRLPDMNSKAIKDAKVLGDLYLQYQAGMHATRVMVYMMPYLNNPAARKEKLEIYIDDDGLEGGDTHHYQLARAFKRLGAELPIGDEEFGDLDELKLIVKEGTREFIEIVEQTYSRSLGPWAIVEVVSDNWLHSLCDGLKVHFPEIVSDPYFAECFEHGVEERHGEQAIETSAEIVARKPELYELFVEDARAVAVKLNRLWDSMLQSVEQHQSVAQPEPEVLA